MAHFYGSMQGNRGEATRCGSKESGIEAHIRGWVIGVRVFCSYDEKLRKDVITIYKTSGSSGHQPSELITTLVEGED